MEQTFKDKVVVITGGSQGIGAQMVNDFAERGARVAVIDKEALDEDSRAELFFMGDLSSQFALDQFAECVLKYFGHVDILINNAPPLFMGIGEASYDDFLQAQLVGVVAPFYLSKLFADVMPTGSSIINISSSRDRQSQPQTETYTAAKGGIAALTHALAVSLGPNIRVNSISPGWIETIGQVYEGADAAQQPCGRVGKPEDISQMAMFLCSDKAGFITGENICIDGGMTRLMIYHNDNGWMLEQ